MDKKVEKKQEAKVDNKDKMDNKNTVKKGHVNAHEPRKTRKYKQLIEKYKKRNKIVEIIIACVVLVLVFILCCNRTFLSTSFSKKVDSSNIEISLPRFTYYIASDDDTVIFKTLRKSENTRAFFDDFITSEKFDIYYCDDKEYYYDSEGKFFITDIKVEKTFAIKTITIKYSTIDKDIICNAYVENDVDK